MNPIKVTIIKFHYNILLFSNEYEMCVRARNIRIIWLLCRDKAAICTIPMPMF